MPSNLRSNTHSGLVNRSCVRVAAMGVTHSGNAFSEARVTGNVLAYPHFVVRQSRSASGEPKGSHCKWLCSADLQVRVQASLKARTTNGFVVRTFRSAFRRA